MYLSSVMIKNYGPIKEMSFETKSDLEKKSNPIVLIGQNGAGKTIFLSNILHALIEIKRKKYDTLLEVSDNNYYRVGSLSYVNSSAMTAYNRIEFTDNASFTEAMTKDYNSFKSTYSEMEYPGISIDNSKLKESGFFESVITPKESVFEKDVYLFFPVERYYTPT